MNLIPVKDYNGGTAVFLNLKHGEVCFKISTVPFGEFFFQMPEYPFEIFYEDDFELKEKLNHPWQSIKDYKDGIVLTYHPQVTINNQKQFWYLHHVNVGLPSPQTTHYMELKCSIKSENGQLSAT